MCPLEHEKHYQCSKLNISVVLPLMRYLLITTESEVCCRNWWDVDRAAKSPRGGVLSEGGVLSPPVLRGPVLHQLVIPPASQQSQSNDCPLKSQYEQLTASQR